MVVTGHGSCHVAGEIVGCLVLHPSIESSDNSLSYVLVQLTP
jgi:hypothetical protein